MRKPLVAGNWKMHGSRVDNAALVRGLLDALKSESAAEVLLCDLGEGPRAGTPVTVR